MADYTSWRVYKRTDEKINTLLSVLNKDEDEPMPKIQLVEDIISKIMMGMEEALKKESEDVS